MKMSHYSIGARMATALGLVLALLLGAALFGIAALYRTLGTYDTTVQQRVAQERAVSRMESEFKTQVLEWKNTLTLDNGKEFAEHRWVHRRLKTRVYFADPHSPWQRGLNENHNGLLRHYFPKGSDLGKASEQEVLQAVYRLNHRPRRCLDWKTPHEVFHGYKVTPLTLGTGALRC